MLVAYLKAKIHRATVTGANLDYQGSITIGPELLEASGIEPFEQVQIYNCTNGERLTTYAIAGTTPGIICVNGAAAFKARANDIIIIASYCLLDSQEKKTFKPNLVFVGQNNRIESISHDNPRENSRPGEH